MRSLIVLVLVAMANPALARDDSVALQHYERAKALANLGDHRGAIRELELSYQASPRPNRLYDIAQQHRILAEAGAMDEMRTSVEFFERYLKDKPDAEDRVQVRELIAQLKARMASAEAEARNVQVKALPAPETALAAAPQPETNPSDRISQPPAPATKSKSRAWIWWTVGGAAVVVTGVAVGLGVAFGQPSTPPDGTLGTYHVPF